MNGRSPKSKAGYWGSLDRRDASGPTTPQARWQTQACVAMTQRSVQFDHRLSYAWRNPMHGGAATTSLGRATPSPTANKTARPQGGAITEWYKGKTGLPIWQQISTEICRP